MSYLKAFIISAAVAFAIIFMVQNIEPLSHPLSIRLNLIFVKFQSTPYATYLIIMLSFFVGLLAASLLGLSERFRLRKQLKAKDKELDNLASELKSLRNLPITSETLSPNGEAEAPKNGKGKKDSEEKNLPAKGLEPEPEPLDESEESLTTEEKEALK
ncbi:lipopolysaccharide assembly protein LapA domain-containing protein [Dethiosulfatarculus sandiegensis]|uniref:Lipopolysaccharide assembly protein A domain-containing protein n=1 Tax=Dethiosulfatarculus sandiegensis TaxID=1429043 RepID=A0A0D2J7W2_9BACT|nr:lipopolysaccharide assembly protein LapA domain-containing protein [Dethiosulfatarculus sandiegensis]KIX11811.1 hypothetical protein X474_22305 [Dethiosulfatarculus sandiegensis]